MTSYRVELSLDGSDWIDALGGTNGIFEGNTDHSSFRSTLFLGGGVRAQYVRVVVLGCAALEWAGTIGEATLRFP